MQSEQTRVSHVRGNWLVDNKPIDNKPIVAIGLIIIYDVIIHFLTTSQLWPIDNHL